MFLVQAYSLTISRIDINLSSMALTLRSFANIPAGAKMLSSTNTHLSVNESQAWASSRVREFKRVSNALDLSNTDMVCFPLIECQGLAPGVVIMGFIVSKYIRANPNKEGYL